MSATPAPAPRGPHARDWRGRTGAGDDARASLGAAWAGDVGGRGLQGGPRGPSAEATPPQPRLPSVRTAPRRRFPGRDAQAQAIPEGCGFGHHVNGTKAKTPPPAHSSAREGRAVSSISSERKAVLARFPAQGAGRGGQGRRGVGLATQGLTSPASRERASPDPFAKRRSGVCLGRALEALPCGTSDRAAQMPGG